MHTSLGKKSNALQLHIPICDFFFGIIRYNLFIWEGEIFISTDTALETILGLAMTD